MAEDANAPTTSPVTSQAEDSEDDEIGDEPMNFNFNGPQSSPEVLDQALQEPSFFNTRSGSEESSQDGALAGPISFNFGPQPVEAPEVDFIAAFASGSRRPQMPAGARELAAALNNRRRAATNREFRGGASAYIDQDGSGTYDPKRARRTPSSSRPAKRAKTSNTCDENGNAKPKRSAKQIGFRYEMVVKLCFKNKKSLDYLRTLPPGPYGSQSSNAEEEGDSDDSGYGGSFKKKRKGRRARLGTTVIRSDGLTIAALTTGHPQRRGCKCCFEQGNDDCSLIEHPDEYPCEACDDADADCVLIILPKFKKVCLRCKAKRRNCSYVLDGGKNVDACDACEEEGVTCCAEPLTKSSSTRRFANLPARIKATPAVPTAAKEPPRERMYVSCNQCRNTGKRCTNRGKADPGPCSNCRKTSQSCKFVHPLTRIPKLPVPSSKTKKTSSSSSRALESTSPGDRLGTPHSPTTLTDTLYSELEKKNTVKANKLIASGTLYPPTHPLFNSIFGSSKPSKNQKYLQTSPKLIGRTLGIAHIHITTSFCHPITFNYVTDPMQKNPCSWCDNPLYGLWGLASTSEPRLVEGFYCANGGGFEEIFGGFSEAGYSRSVMCIECTYSRVRITQCPAHRLRALDPRLGEIDLDALNGEKWDRARKAYGDGDMNGGALVEKAKWCSVCPATAYFACCTSQLFDENGEPVPPHSRHPSSQGCGLLLCEDCASLLQKLIKGGARSGSRQLDAMVSEVKRNTWRFTEGIRADAEFLTSKGELLMRIGEGMGASTGKMDGKGELRVGKVNGEGGWIAGDGVGFERKQGNGVGEKSLKGKGKAEIAEKAWAEYKAREKEARGSEMGGTSRTGGKVTLGSFGEEGTNGPMRWSSSTASSSKNPKIERRSSSGTNSSQNTSKPRSYQPQESSLHTNKSIAPNLPRPSSAYTHRNSNPKPASHSHSHAHPPSTRDMNGHASGPGSATRYSYRTGAGKQGIERERESRGEIQFGGLMKERKEDVEKAFRGQLGLIDLTDDE